MPFIVSCASCGTRSIDSVSSRTYRVLRAATSDAAIFLGIEEDTGTVELGKAANLILVDGNPREALEALWHLEGVMVAGLCVADDITYLSQYGEWLLRVNRAAEAQ